MNSFKYCPNCGTKQHQLTSLLQFNCVYCDFTFFQNSAAAVAGIIQVKNKLLFTKRAKDPGKNKLDLPGGFVDHNENLETALTREVKEELGIIISHWQYLCSGINNYKYKEVIYQTCDAIYYCKLDEFPIIEKEDTEISDFMWFSKEDIPFDEIGFESLRHAVERFVS